METVVGIDLGASRSRVSVMRDGSPRLLADDDGATAVPSVVGFTGDAGPAVGRRPESLLCTDPEATLPGARRLLGRNPSDDVVRRFRQMLGADLATHDDTVAVELGGERRTPVELVSMILAHLRELAASRLDASPRATVIAVPVRFTDDRLEELKRAAELADLEVRRLLSAPTSAALAYGYARGADATIAVVDVGGGCVDASIIDLQNGVFEVLASAGSETVGGLEWDRTVAEHLIGTFQSETGLQIADNPGSLRRVLRAAESARRTFSRFDPAHVAIPDLRGTGGATAHLRTTIHRREFRSLVDDHRNRLDEICRRVLAESEVGDGLDELMLCGGMARAPLVRRTVERAFDMEANPELLRTDLAARGAAVEAEILSGRIDEFFVLDVTPMDLGVRAADGSFLPIIPKNTSIPTRESRVFRTADAHQSVVTVEVLQGTSDRADENRLLEAIRITDLASSEGRAEIEVDLEIDSDGIVSVSAREVDTGRGVSTTFTGAVTGSRTGSSDANRDDDPPDSELRELMLEEGHDYRDGDDEWRHRPSTGVVDADALAAARGGDSDSNTTLGGQPTDPEVHADSEESGEKWRDSRSRDRQEMIDGLNETNATRIRRKIENLEDPVDDEEAQGYFNRGYEEYRSHAHPTALRYFEKAFQYDPDDALFKTFYAYTLFLTDPTEKDRAKQLLREALWEDDPQVAPDTHFFLGRILKVKENHSLARHHFRKALDLDPHLRGAERELRLYEQREEREQQEEEEEDDPFAGLFDLDSS